MYGVCTVKYFFYLDVTVLNRNVFKFPGIPITCKFDCVSINTNNSRTQAMVQLVVCPLQCQIIASPLHDY